MNTADTTTELGEQEIRSTVRERYGWIAEAGSGCGCAPSCCSPATSLPSAGDGAGSVAQALGYSLEQTRLAPEGSNLGLGCGNPQAIAALRPGEVVLDLGSGAGFDVFLAARAVGPSGRVIGVDMTPEMISRARTNQTQGAYANTEFRLGEIENLPVADASVDVIVSNCVINLSPDKRRVFREAFRVLKPGGRLAVSDVVALSEIPEGLRKDWELYTGCIAGASTAADLEAGLRLAGFTRIRIVPKPESAEIVGQWFPGRNLERYVASAAIEAVKP